MNVITVNKVPVQMNLEQQVIYEVLLAELMSIMLPDFDRTVSTIQEIQDYQGKKGAIQDHALMVSKRIVNTMANRRKEQS